MTDISAQELIKALSVRDREPVTQGDLFEALEVLTLFIEETAKHTHWLEETTKTGPATFTRREDGSVVMKCRGDGSFTAEQSKSLADFFAAAPIVTFIGAS